MDIHLVTSYNTPVSRRESFLFFSRPGPSRLQKLSIEDSSLLGESDFHMFLRGPEDVSVKRGYTLLYRRVLCYVVLHQKGGLDPEVFRVASIIWGQPSLGGNISHVLLSF